MTVVAEFTIPVDALPVGDVLREMPGLTVELERIVPTDSGAIPFFWAFGNDDVEAFVDRARADPAFDAIEVLERVDGAVLLKATWRPESEVLRAIKTLGATIMSATATDEEWRFRVRGADRERLDEFQRVFTDRDVPVRLERIYNLSEMVDTGRPLTDEQRETLLVAYREGYFDQPRGITQEELAEQFGISGRAVSNRLRRGLGNLVASTLVGTGPDDGAGDVE